MASLIEELIVILEKEDQIYMELIPVEESKTKIIISNDLIALQDITDTEQSMITQINGLESKRQEVITNIGIVISRDPNTLDLKTLANLLDGQPEEQKRLSQIHDKIKGTIHRLVELNYQNQSLIEQSLDLIEFNMNFMQSTRMSLGNNYNKNASGTINEVEQTRMFDAKQ